MNTATIYTLDDPVTGHVRYVGKSFNPELRFKRHLGDKTGTHKSFWIQSLKNKGTKPNLGILEVFPAEDVEAWQAAEGFWIESLQQMGCNLTNLDKGGVNGLFKSEASRLKMSNSAKGRRFSEETRLKISLALVGRPRPKEVCEKVGRALKGRKISELQKQQISLKMKGFKHSEETKAKLRELGKNWKPSKRMIEMSRKSRLGSRHSEETKKLISDKIKALPPCSEETRLKKSLNGKLRVQSEDCKRKISVFQKGRIKSEEERKNISEGLKGVRLGVKFSEAHKMKISLGRKAYYERLRKESIES